MATRTFTLTYDYRCPFACIMHLHVLRALEAGADFAVTFAPWSLNQPHRHEGDPDVWLDPRRSDDLAALAASVSVRDQQPEFFLRAHEALFEARHRDGKALKSLSEILEVLQELGVDTDAVASDVASGRPAQVIGASHTSLADKQPFGVPTFFVGEASVFVRYMDLPTSPEQSLKLVNHLLDTIEFEPAINEFKHTYVPR